jgi:hypothetical protein
MSKDLIVRIAHNLVKTIEENNNFNKIIYEKKTYIQNICAYFYY